MDRAMRMKMKRILNMIHRLKIKNQSFLRHRLPVVSNRPPALNQ